MKNRAPKGAPDPTIDWVSASDVASYRYCARSYFLARVQHFAPDRHARKRLREGTKNHERHGRTYARQLKSKRTALMVLAGTMLLAYLLWLFVRFHG